MKRYAAFLRGVMPTNCKMPELKKAFERAGFSDVKTLLSSGNVVFGAPTQSAASLERKAEAAMEKKLGRSFFTIVRSIEELQRLLATDPYRGSRVPAEAKRIVTFLRDKPPAGLVLPAEMDGARIVALVGSEAFSAYMPTPKGPVFMTLLERTFGKEQTTRTWLTVEKVARS